MACCSGFYGLLIHSLGLEVWTRCPAGARFEEVCSPFFCQEEDPGEDSSGQQGMAYKPFRPLCPTESFIFNSSFSLHFGFEPGCPVADAVLELTVQPGTALNSSLL